MVTGLLWLVPAMFLIRWMIGGDRNPDKPQGAGRSPKQT